MVDTYTMILWAKANNDKLDIQVKRVFEILNILNQISYLKPKYLTSYKKNDIIEFELTLGNIEKLIIQKKDKYFTELGSKFSFFTSLNDDESIGISISIGVSKPGFQNNIVIELNADYKEKKVEEFDEIAEVFKKLVVVSEPFYGCISSQSNCNMFGTYYDKKANLPTSVFDINYFGEGITNRLPIHKIVDKVYECEKIEKGYYLRLQKEVINTLDINHMNLQGNINDLLGIRDNNNGR